MGRSLLLAGCLLACHGTASAEPTWAVWRERSALTPPGSAAEWHLLRASLSENDCAKVKANALESFVSQRKQAFQPLKGRHEIDVKGDVVFEAYPQGSSSVFFAIRFVCLPDTIDPRQARGLRPN